MRIIRIIEYKAEREEGIKWLKATLEHCYIKSDTPLIVKHGHIKLIDQIIEVEEVIW